MRCILCKITVTFPNLATWGRNKVLCRNCLQEIGGKVGMGWFEIEKLLQNIEEEK